MRYFPVALDSARPLQVQRGALSALSAASAGKRMLAVFAFLFASVLVSLSSMLPATAATATEPSDNRRVVLIGTAGLRWADISAENTPNISNFAQASAVGNLIVRNVRTSTCPADGWLALSAGNRAGDSINGAGSACRYLEEPAASEDVVEVPNWEEYLAAVAEQKYSAQLGSFAQVLTNNSIPTVAMGPGAAIALADSSGIVTGEYFDRPAAASDFRARTSAALNSLTDPTGLLVIDAGQVRASRTAQNNDAIMAAQASELDSRIEGILRAVYEQDPKLTNTTVMLASLADPLGTPRISLLAMAGEGVEGNYLTSPSTRQSGYNQATDLPTTLFGLLEADYSEQRSTFVGSKIGFENVAGTGTDRINQLIDDEDHTLAARPLVGSFFLIYVIANIALFAVVSYIFSGTFLKRAATGNSWFTRNTRAIIRACEIAGVSIAALPIASLIANIFPWWRSPAETLTLIALTLVVIAAIVGITLIPVWRTWRFAPIAVVSLITAATLAIDIATGATLQLGAMIGVQPMVGGRFYGFNNQAFTLFAVSTVLLAGAVSNPLVVVGKRRLAALSVAIIGIVAIVLDGFPSLGADFGGPPAMFPAFALLALMALGTKLSWKKILAVLVAAGLLVSSFAVVDWMRPADQRTHLGRFVDTVIDGGFFDVVGRKLAAGLSTFTNPLSLVAIAAILVLLVVLGRPMRSTANPESELAPYHWITNGVPLRQLAKDTPMFMPAIYAVYVVVGIGTLVNDSSVVILGVGLGTLVPLLIATYARWILELSVPKRGVLSTSNGSPEPQNLPSK